MRSFSRYIVLVLLAALPLFSADNKSSDAKTTTAHSAKGQLVKGHLVDVACARENAESPKADFASKHNKACLQMADCKDSGYAVLTADNKLIKFDAAGNEMAKKFISASNKDADWKVAVIGNVNGDVMSVSSLELEK